SVATSGFASTMSLRTTGTRLSASWSPLSSCSRTKPLAAMAGSDVNSRPTWMSPFLSASTVSGPPASSGLNSLNVSPYVPSRPLRQNGRSGRSGGPPSTSVLAIDGPALAGSLLAGSSLAAAGADAGADAAADADGDELPPPDEHALSTSASDVAPRAAMRVI